MKTLTDLQRWAASAQPNGTTLSVECLCELLGELEPEREPEPVTPEPPTWQVLLGTVKTDTRMGRDRLLEAVGRPRFWLYWHTGPAATDRIPTDGSTVNSCSSARCVGGFGSGRTSSRSGRLITYPALHSLTRGQR